MFRLYGLRGHLVSFLGGFVQDLLRGEVHEDFFYRQLWRCSGQMGCML